MIARRLSWSGVVLALILPGCVVEKQDFDALRDQVRLQQRQINDLKSRQEEMSLRSDALNNGFKILGDKAEENAQRLDELVERETQPALQALEPVPAAAALQASEPPAAARPQTPVEGPILLTNLPETPQIKPPPGGQIITAGPKAEKLYAGALSLYSGRDYQQASAKFREFVDFYPDHTLAGNAQYWIGECLYSQGRFAEAGEEFARVETDYPTSHKIPAALLKKGLSLEKLKRMPEAQAVLQQLVERYGKSEEAAKAKEKLERWKQP